MFIEKIKGNFKEGKPIFVEDIISLFPEFTKAYIYRLLKKSDESGELVRFSRGVYCIPKKTFFGYGTTTPSKVAMTKYVTDGNSIYGVYAGLSLLNYFTISTQIPNVLEIVTNNETTRKRMVTIRGMKYLLRKSRFKITKFNYKYYSLLQLFLELGTNTKIDTIAKREIEKYIAEKNIKRDELLKWAMYFPAQTIKNLIGSEVFNEIS